MLTKGGKPFYNDRIMTSNSLVNSILGTTMNDYSCTDFSATIKGEIERDVLGLIEACKDRIAYHESLDWELSDGQDCSPKYIELGYLVNTHHGKDLYKPGDLICGLPVRIDRFNIRSITVFVGNLEFKNLDYRPDDNDDCEFSSFDDKRIEASTTW